MNIFSLFKRLQPRTESLKNSAVAVPIGADAYHSDAPLNDPSQDDFDRGPFACRIAETIVARSDPASLCIGIYGKWGEGKTTVLNFIERQLAPHEDIEMIHFNPWRFRTEDDLFVGFFSALAAGIGKSLKTSRERAAEAVAPYTKILGPVSVGLGLPGVGSVNVSAAQLTKSLTEAARADVKTLKARLNELINETEKKLVIVVDDVDRMDRAQIHAVFKLIKACGDFLHTIYVLAFDDKAVAAALGSEYGEGNEAAGYDFLEKIVQVPLRLPAASGLRRHAHDWNEFSHIDYLLIFGGAKPSLLSDNCVAIKVQKSVPPNPLLRIRREAESAQVVSS